MALPGIRFGRTGLMVSRLALGTMTFGLQTDEALARQILDKAAAAGINFLDTADVYPLGGGLASAGRTEEILGRWLSDPPGRRRQFIVATKAVGAMGAEAWHQGASRKHLLAAIDASLARLQTDHVDLYQLHSDDAGTPLDETLEALDVIVRSGRARYIGVSNFLAWRLAKALGRAETLRLTKFVSVQPRYSLLFREIERELLPLAAEDGLAVLPYNPLAGGLLTAKHRAGSAPTPGTRFTLGNAADRHQQRYWHAHAFATVGQLDAVAAEAGVPLTTLALAWVLAHPAITAPLLGASHPAQLDDSLAAAHFVLEPALKQRLDALTVEYRRGDAER
jgi:aryl-alcohol dehydrogenase-like predicted oxidoreductase